MTETVKPKVYSIRNFVAAGEHEHYISADTHKLLHSGDYVRLSTKQNLEVAKVKFVMKMTVVYHFEEIGGGGSRTGYATKSFTLDSSSDYELTCHERSREALKPMGIGVTEDKSAFIDNMDITITLAGVIGLDGSSGKIGQDPTTGSGIEWDTIISACTWVLGITGLLIGGYVAYRVYRWHWHGEALFPRLTKMLHGGE